MKAKAWMQGCPVTCQAMRTKTSPDYQTKHDKAKINIQINRNKEATQTAKNGHLWKTRR